ncbi:MAG: hypothetical protein O3A25_02260 [Acidobacteria bacterium]|nr:hypothetical protein [Acidobacteriota bacterium]
MTRSGVIGFAVFGLLAPGVVAALAQTTDQPRTAWGTPDFSGYWAYRTTTPLERPTSLADKPVLTPAEAADYLSQRWSDIRSDRDLQLNADWWEPGGLTDDRTSLIVDPPDGRLPTLSADARHRNQTIGLASRLRPTDGPEDRERYERCMLGRTVPLLAVAPGHIAQFFQTPDYLVILHEQNWDTRVIRIVDGPHPADRIRLWQGDSYAHWEGDTLVVLSANFNGAWTLNGTSANMQVEERIASGDDGTLDYQFTIDDPESFAGPWTVSFPITPTAGPLFEHACHAGNYSMPLILSGARAEERRSATPR